MKKPWFLALLFIGIAVSLFIVLSFKNTPFTQDKGWESGLIPAELIPELSNLEMESSVRLDTPLAVDENYLYALTKNNYFVKYDKQDNFKKVTEKSTGISHHIRSFAIDNNFLYVASWNGEVYVYNKTDLDRYTTIKSHSHMVMALYLTEDYLYTGSWDCSLKIWDKKNFSLIDAILLNNTGTNPVCKSCPNLFCKGCQINSIATGENKIYVACENSYLLILDKNTKYQNKLEVYDDFIFDDHPPLNVDYLDIDDTYLYSVSGNFLRIWDKNSLNLIKKMVCSSTDVAYSVKVDKRMVYCGGSEVYFFDKHDFIPAKIELPFDKQIIHDIVFDEDNVYLGSMENNLFIINKENKQLKEYFEII